MQRDGGSADIDVSTGHERHIGTKDLARGWLSTVELPDWTAIAGILLAGLVARLFAIGHEAYYIDETITIWYAQHHTPLELLTVIPTSQPHPPLFFMLADVWVSLVGTGEAVTRLPSAVFGVLTVGAIAALGWRLYSQRVGVLAGVITAIAPFHVMYSQWFRMYALLGLLATVGTYCIYSWVRTQRRTWAVGYAVVAFLLAGTHAYGLLVVGAHLSWVAIVVLSGDDLSRRRVAISLSPVVVVGPFGAALLGKALRPDIFGSINQATLNSAVSVNWIAYAPTYMLTTHPEYLGVTAVAFVVHIGLLLTLRRRLVDTSLLWLWLALPVGVALVVSFWHPIIRYKFLMAVSPALYLLVAAGIDSVQAVPLRVAMAVLLLVSLLPSLGAVYAFDQFRPYDDAADYLEENVPDSDLVLVHSGPNAPPAFYFSNLTANTVVVDMRYGPRHTSAQTGTITDLIESYDCIWVVHDRPLTGVQESLVAHFSNYDRVSSAVFTRERRGMTAGVEIERFATPECDGKGGE